MIRNPHWSRMSNPQEPELKLAPCLCVILQEGKMGTREGQGSSCHSRERVEGKGEFCRAMHKNPCELTSRRRRRN